MKAEHAHKRTGEVRLSAGSSGFLGAHYGKTRGRLILSRLSKSGAVTKVTPGGDYFLYFWGVDILEDSGLGRVGISRPSEGKLDQGRGSFKTI